MKALRIFCLGGLLLLYAQVGMGQDSIRTEHLQEVKVNARQHRILTSTSPLQLLDKGDMLRLGVTDMADALHRMPGINLRDYGGAGGMKTVAVRGFGAGHTGVSYDGVLLSECQGGEIDVSRYSLDQVQTLRLTIGDNDDIFISARQASFACHRDYERDSHRQAASPLYSVAGGVLRICLALSALCAEIV